MRKAGYTNVAIGLALESLNRKAMIEYFEDSDWNGNQFTACKLTSKGVDWMLANQQRFKMRRDEGIREPEKIASGPITDEDIPILGASLQILNSTLTFLCTLRYLKDFGSIVVARRMAWRPR
jgi:hypothetical protein